MIRVDSKELSVYCAKDNDNLAFKSSAEFVSVSLLYETAIHKEMRLPPSLHSIIRQLSRKNNQTLADFNE